MKWPDLRPALLTNLRRRPDRDVALQRYALLAKNYENATSKIRDVRRRAIDLLALRSGETVFDVACGTGAMLPDMAWRVGPRGCVIGIEQSAPMSVLACAAIRDIPQAQVHVCPVESFVSPRPADALAFIYAHDVQQDPAALAAVFAQARPGARVVAAGLCLLPWRRLPINAWVLWGARHYLTTWHGLRRPWQPLLDSCPDLQIVDRFHDGTTYVATGTVAPPRVDLPERRPR